MSIGTILRFLEMMGNKQIIFFFYETGGFSFKSRLQLKDFLILLFKKEKTPLQSLNYIFCTDDYLLEINKSYLQHDYYTDIVSFNLTKTGPVEGEIYISIDRVKENAKDIGVSFQKELHRVIFHGALHLCGYKDQSKKHQNAMRTREDHYLALYLK